MGSRCYIYYLILTVLDLLELHVPRCYVYFIMGFAVSYHTGGDM